MVSTRTLLAAFAATAWLRAEAQIAINPGLSGGWFEPATSGQGLLIDVVPDSSQIYAGWYTFAAAEAKGPGSSEQRWLSAQGSYSGSVAELVLYSASGGIFDLPGVVTQTPVGSATIEFHSCLSATYHYDLPGDGLNGSISLTRIGPDVFCQGIVDEQTVAGPEYNQPPSLSELRISDDGQQIRVDFALSDMEDSALEVGLEVLYSDGLSYRIPPPLLSGHAGYPVLPGATRQLRWRYGEDAGFLRLGLSAFRLRLWADDRFASTLQEIVDLVSEERLIADISLMDGVRHHSSGPGGQLDRTRDHIRGEISARGLLLTQQLFNYQGDTGFNIIGSLIGSEGPDDYYLIDGHYDTVATTPGADDNASGTAGMLEAMRVLSQFNARRSIRFVGFDKEELGLRGSRHYAATIPPDQTVLGMINFEMIGYTCTTQPEYQAFPNADTSIYNIRSSFAQGMSDVFVAVGNTHVPGLKITSVRDDGDFNFRRSDHAPFWDAGVDALFLSDGANFRTPHYHQASDRLQFLDTEFMANVVRTAVGTLATQAGITHQGEAISGIIHQ